MGTATLKSIFERTVDQITNVNTTDKSPSHKNQDEKTPSRKLKISENIFMSIPLCERAPFLKQNCVKVSRISEKTRNNITLNVGEKDSVKTGMPVITDRGLVGKIVATSANYSIAQILLNKDLKISAKDQRSRVDGILSWDGENKLQLKNVSKSSDVLVGDVVITSEYSNHFPAGIPIGYTLTAGTVDNLFKKIEVEPFVNFETLEEVFVLRYLSNEERQSLEKKYFESK